MVLGRNPQSRVSGGGSGYLHTGSKIHTLLGPYTLIFLGCPQTPALLWNPQSSPIPISSVRVTELSAVLVSAVVVTDMDWNDHQQTDIARIYCRPRKLINGYHFWQRCTNDYHSWRKA